MKRENLKAINMKLMCEKTGLSYNIVRDYVYGRKDYLTDYYIETIKQYIIQLVN